MMPATTNPPPQAMIPFGEGDTLPDIILPNSRERLVRFSTYVGDRKQVLLFCPDPALPECQAKLQSFADLAQEPEGKVVVFGVTNTDPKHNAAALEAAPLPFQLLSDLDRQAAKILGIEHNLAPPTDGRGKGAFTVVVCDVNRRVLKVMRDIADFDPGPDISALLASLPKREARSLGHFAPVLYVPKVFEPAFCKNLIAAFEQGESVETGFRRQTSGHGESDHVIDRTRKSRHDHLVTDERLLQEIRRRIDRRIVPEVQAAFTRLISGAEQYKVVCYEAELGGHFSTHRDNTVKHDAHRRFAMTLNLNPGNAPGAEYSGGHLTFPEYGPDLYAPEIGDAVVFSCSLLHRAMPVTSGKRYVLLAFFFDEESRTFNDRFPK